MAAKFREYQFFRINLEQLHLATDQYASIILARLDTVGQPNG